MMPGYEKKEILILVKTYPNPSRNYVETVCTAGVTKSGNWIRLYPVSFRYLNDRQQYPKYSWIGAEVTKASNDHRIESYKPVMESIEVIRRPLKGSNKWNEAKSILLPNIQPSLCELMQLRDKNISLGMFKPLTVTDFYWTQETPEWSEQQKQALIQQNLFGIDTKILKKIPYSFHYKFRCNYPTCPGHNLTINDWEIYQAYINWRKKYNADELLQKIKEKWYDKFFAPSRDTYFIVGTHHVFKTFMILGVFWPPKDDQISLF